MFYKQIYSAAKMNFKNYEFSCTKIKNVIQKPESKNNLLSADMQIFDAAKA